MEPEAAPITVLSVGWRRPKRGQFARRPPGQKEGYGVYAPIWGHVFHRSLHDLAAVEAMPQTPFSEPRIEPEVVFGLADAPSALRHLVGLLASDPVHPPLAAVENVNTGTLTKAMPIVAGETWTAAPTGIALDAIQLRFS